MAEIEVIVPSLGEGIHEITIIKWLKAPGESIGADEPLVEIATDKVDSEIVSPASGTVVKLLYSENQPVPVGNSIAIIETSEQNVVSKHVNEFEKFKNLKISVDQEKLLKFQQEYAVSEIIEPTAAHTETGAFLSPLVRRIIKTENIPMEKINTLSGSGLNQRITKYDILELINNPEKKSVRIAEPVLKEAIQPNDSCEITPNQDVEIIEMDRMRKLISEHMIHSIQTSAHVSTFIETDASAIVFWREKVKNEFQAKYGQKLTYTPIFIEAIVNAIKDFPRINASVDGTKIILKKNINIGMATALPSGNLIVPVIKNCQDSNLIEITQKVNDLSDRARNNKLMPDEVQGGTFTVTNIGTFGNIAGTPIINQPEIAILALGAIQKKPAVVSTEYGDTIGIKQLMILSLTFDHRIIDGALGGMFLQKVSHNIENFDVNRNI